MEISQALSDRVFHPFQECLGKGSCSKSYMEVGKSFADEKEALPFLLGWESSKQHTCAKVQAPWERKPRLNLQLLEEAGGRAGASPSQCHSGKAHCWTEDCGRSVQEPLSARPHLLSSPPVDFIKEINRCPTCEWWGGGNDILKRSCVYL